MRSARAIVVAVSAFALAADASPCAPAAHVTGDRDAVARVSAELARLGVAVDARQAGCPAPLEAAVELAGSGLSVAVRDAAQRSEGRTVDNATVAAEWIDSWLRDSLDPWRELAPPSAASVSPPVAATRPVAATAAPGDEEVRASAATPARPSLLDRLEVSAGFEETYTSDGTSWRGLAVAACARVGGACLGLRGRYATQSIALAQTAADRRDLSLLATASTTFRVSTTRISPELGIGVGAITTARVDGCPPQCDPATSPSCPPAVPTNGPSCDDASGNPVYVGDHFQSTTVTPRAALAVRIAVPLAPRLYLDALAGAMAMPFAHGDSYQADRTPPGLQPNQVALPGEPTFALQLAIGLRMEAD
jgi:hypothetical protein|nr:hypothetical protein [Kofleriaceae bacterium]